MRDLKGRIGSVASSEKITGAMKMISSAKMDSTYHQSSYFCRCRIQFTAHRGTPCEAAGRSRAQLGRGIVWRIQHESV